MTDVPVTLAISTANEFETRVCVCVCTFHSTKLVQLNYIIYVVVGR